MKTPEEIKMGMRYCYSIAHVITGNDGCKANCPYWDRTFGCGCDYMVKDALAYIQRLEAEREKLLSFVKPVAPCSDCKHCYEHILRCDENDFLCDECYMDSCACKHCEENCNWEWNGKGLPEPPEEDAHASD